ncbi:MAG: carboxypeptidase M32 [Pirellulales bacterium]
MTSTAQTALDQLCDHARQTALLSSTLSLLEWDERTKLPSAGGDYRAEQIAYLAGLIHQRETDPKIGHWLDSLEGSPLAADRHSDDGTTVRQIRREYDKKTRLPQDLVEAIARTSVQSQQVWVEARRQKDYARFRPHLEVMIRLKREEAAALGYEDDPYDALLDEYEPDARTGQVAHVLGQLRDALQPLVQSIVDSGRTPNRSILERSFPRDRQEQFGRRLAEQIGFDFNEGRLDETVHPFCAGMGPRDTRITTRYEPFVASSIYTILHEAGHGIYDQQLRSEVYGLPPGNAVSLGIHESQSRMWENFVGRSRAFWEHWYGPLQEAFPDATSGVPLDDFYFLINDVHPSLIRVEADEATYNLHILVRFELEHDLIGGGLSVDDLPEAWNAKYEQLLGITPPDDAQGVLQDVHFSAGLFGYFPTYSLGNLYAAQIFEQAERDLGDLADMFRRGEFTPLRQWLGENIHQHGQRYTAAELVERITGKPLSHEPLMKYLRGKFAPLYGLK